MGRYVYEHRGNGLIVDNIMKPLKGALSAAVNKAGRAVAKAISKRAGTAKAAAAKVEKSGVLIRRRLAEAGTQKLPEVEAEHQSPVTCALDIKLKCQIMM